MTTQFAFTVKKNGLARPTSCDYDEWLMNARRLGFDVQMFRYELGKTDRLHIHGVGEYKGRLIKKRLMLPGFHQQINEIPSFLDLKRWNDYCTKEYQNDEAHQQRIMSYHIRHSEYPFVLSPYN